LTREPFLIEELRTKLQLSSTKNVEAHLVERRREGKKEEERNTSTFLQHGCHVEPELDQR
jgi:hypothetical protein